ERLIEVDQLCGLGVGEDAFRLADIGVDYADMLISGYPMSGERGNNRIGVYAYDPGGRVGSQRDVVDAAYREQATAEIKKLADAGGGGGEPHCRAEEGAIGPDGGHDLRDDREQLVGGLSVDREVVAAAEEVVVDPGRVGEVEVHHLGCCPQRHVTGHERTTDAQRQGWAGEPPGRRAGSPIRTPS